MDKSQIKFYKCWISSQHVFDLLFFIGFIKIIFYYIDNISLYIIPVKVKRISIIILVNHVCLILLFSKKL